MFNKTLFSLALYSAILLFMSACQDNVSPGIEESLDLFAGLEAIPEAQQSVVTINKGNDDAIDGFFSIDVDNITATSALAPGKYQAWCLEWNKNLRSNGDEHRDVKWFSTASSNNWKPLNYLLSKRDQLQADDPELTFRDFQAVIWVLAGQMGIAPEFDVLNMPVDRLPGRLRSGNEIAFSREKAAAIARRVMEEAPEATVPLTSMVAQTADDEQDIIVRPPDPVVSDFITVWDTTLGPGTTVTLALAGTVDAIISWGDGTVETVNKRGPHTHDYGREGVFTVSVNGIVTAYNSKDYGVADDTKKLIEVRYWGLLEFNDFTSAFEGAENLTSVPNTSQGIEEVSVMADMFHGATRFNSPIDIWDTSIVKDMSGMFRDASSFNQPIDNWNTAVVTNMSGMFAGASSFNQDLGNWNTAAVTDMSTMFAGASSFNRDIRNWNTAAVTDMSGMFEDASMFNEKIDSWNTAAVTDMSGMFAGAFSFNQELTNFNTSAVTDMRSMFAGASSFNQDLGNWNTSAVIDMSGMFFDASSFNQNLQNWNTSAVTNMSGMFFGASSFNQAVDKWNTAAVTDMSVMFKDASVFNQDLGNWNTEAVADMRSMFEGASMFNEVLGNWNTSAVTDMSFMFRGASSFNRDIGNWNTAAVTDMSFMFTDASSFNSDIGNWNTAAVTNMSGMFNGASSFNQAIDNWNTAAVTDMSYMFTGASSFNRDIRNWNTATVTDMRGMFQNAISFNYSLFSWCVELIPSKPLQFDTGASGWITSRPNWGASCVP